jgi:membrane protein
VTKKGGPPLSLKVVWTLARRTVRDADRDRVLGLSAEVAFFGLFAFPPTMLTILGAVGWLGDLLGSSVADRTARTIVDFSALALSESAVRDVVKPTVERLLQEGRLDVVSIGALVALWSASRAAYALIDALRIAYDVDGKIALWRRNARAIVLTLGGILFSGLALPLLTIGPRFGAGLAGSVGLATTFETLWSALFWPLLVAFAILALTWLYNYAIPWKTPFWRDLPGAVLAMALWLVFGVGLRAYGAWVVDASPVYGSLAAPMVMLLWLYLTTLALLMGGELNAEVEKMWPTISRAERERVRRAAERDVDDDELMLSTQAPEDLMLPVDSSRSGPTSTSTPSPMPESQRPSPSPAQPAAAVPKRDVEQTMKSAERTTKSPAEHN